MKICPERWGASYTLRELARLRTRHPPRTLGGVRLETDLNVDWRRTALRTMAWRDFSQPRVVCIHSKTKQKGGGVGNVSPQPDFWRKNIKTSFFDIMLEVQKDLEDVSTGIGKFKKIWYILEFCPEFDVKVGKVNFDLAR